MRSYACLPQGTRTETEERLFRSCLSNMHLLYSGVRVLILHDHEYSERFWTNYEAWLSMKTMREGDLRPAKLAGRPPLWRLLLRMGEGHDDERRWTIVSEEANKTAVLRWQRMWWTVPPFVAINKLKAPTVRVTNEKDKPEQIAKIVQVLTSIAATYLKSDDVQVAYVNHLEVECI